MEVHHLLSLYHGKHNFREYFLEFLMILLAVVLGSIAENVREHFSDGAKEREYMRSMINNLKSDTTNIKEISRSFEVSKKIFRPEYISVNDIYQFSDTFVVGCTNSTDKFAKFNRLCPI